MRYIIRCRDASNRWFEIAGTFRSDWAAIEFALSMGAMAARPTRHAPAGSPSGVDR